MTVSENVFQIGIFQILIDHIGIDGKKWDKNQENFYHIRPDMLNHHFPSNQSNDKARLSKCVYGSMFEGGC
jgi:hypothetical protein